MSAYRSNFDIAVSYDPMPQDGSGTTGSLPAEILLDHPVSRAQSANWNVSPAEKPGTTSGLNRGVN